MSDFNSELDSQFNESQRAEPLQCGHPPELRVYSIESEYAYCELCECQSRLRDALEMERVLSREKAARVYYQDIVYHVCNVLDRIMGNKATQGTGIVCGTVETPTRQVQEAMDELAMLFVQQARKNQGGK